MWLNDLFWGIKGTLFGGNYHFLVMNHHFGGPSVHCGQILQKNRLYIYIFYWPSGGIHHHWQPHKNRDLYIKTRKMYCQFFMGGQKQITGCYFIDVLRLLCSAVVARQPLLRQFVSASPSPFWQDFGNIWSPQPLPNASFCVIVT